MSAYLQPDRSGEAAHIFVMRKLVCRQDVAPAALDIKFREDDSTDEDSDDSAAEPHIVMDLACGVFDLKVLCFNKALLGCLKSLWPTRSPLPSWTFWRVYTASVQDLQMPACITFSCNCWLLIIAQQSGAL